MFNYSLVTYATILRIAAQTVKLLRVCHVDRRIILDFVYLSTTRARAKASTALLYIKRVSTNDLR